MKLLTSIALSGLALILSGCTTSSKVQEMIDASYREQTDQVAAHGASIDVLKKTAMASLEKGKENAALLKQIQAELVTMNAQIKMNKGFAEASKVMSAANTVKAAELDELLKENTKSDQLTKERMEEIDTLYEETMLAHYGMILESAQKAIDNLRAGGRIGSTNAPVEINAPIEIVAPTTAPVTNAAVVQ
ncbi:hypothetical protein P4C99_18160 [Pontiellaceae bacterium B1224]|nr:hypothetical protein [Pontiellaceae bacterium B1224]